MYLLLCGHRTGFGGCRIGPSVAAQGKGWGLTSKCRLAPPLKHTGEESERELCGLSNFDRFCSQNM